MVIGNEILSGNIVDTNTPWLAKTLHARGVDLLRVEYIADDMEDIKSTVLRLKKLVGPEGAVFTSGGIGPTHDDVTYEALAAALGAKLERHPATVARMQEHYTKRGVELNEARLRMATLPSPADEVLFTDGTWVPLVAVQGVYVLPGIPKLFQSMVAAHVQRFQGSRFFSQTLFTQLGEGDLAVALTKVSSEHAKVAIGSYPNTSADAKDGWYKVKMSFTARDEAAVSAAVEAARQALGAGNTFHAQPSDQ